MTEYIERKIALSIREPSKSNRYYQTYNLDDAYGQGWDDALCCIESIPIADVAPMRHGRWIGAPLCGYGTCECSECGSWYKVYVDSHGEIMEKYCPNCGARMDEVSE